MKHYFYGTTYLSIIFCTLRGHTRTRREKHIFTNLAALAYFFDDLVDAYRNQDDSGMLWENNPEEYGKTADERGLALHFLGNVYAELPPADLGEFREFMHKVFNVETAGRQTSSTSALPIEALQRITAEKGGYSALLFRRVLAHPFAAGEQEAIFRFGHLIQLCDDIFDAWFDRQEGTVTVATTMLEQNKVPELVRLLEEQVALTKKAFFQTDYPYLYSRTAWGAVHFIVTVTRVCLRHYQVLSRQYPQLPLADRHAMVVDMEKWGNRLRSAYYLVAKI